MRFKKYQRYLTFTLPLVLSYQDQLKYFIVNLDQDSLFDPNSAQHIFHHCNRVTCKQNRFANEKQLRSYSPDPILLFAHRRYIIYGHFDSQDIFDMDN